jgi:hypothetical protein
MFAAVNQNPVWIHSLKSINPTMRLAKLGRGATGCQLPLADALDLSQEAFVRAFAANDYGWDQ